MLSVVSRRGGRVLSSKTRSANQKAGSWQKRGLKILVATKTTPECMSELKKIGQVVDGKSGVMPQEELISKIGDVDGLYCVFKNKIDKTLLDKAPKLKVISTMSVGFDHIDVEECKKRSIVVGHTPGVLTDTTADLVVSLLMSTARKIPEASETVYNGKWANEWDPFWLCGKDVHHSTIGIIGMGRIGQAVARRLKGFNCKIIYHGPREKHLDENLKDSVFVPKLDDLLAQSDFVIPLCLLNNETRGMFNKNSFAKFKKGAYFINAGRGQLVNQTDLIEALKSGQVGAAGLDVTDPEPLPLDHPLLDPKLKDRLLIIPHIGSASMQTRTKMAQITTANLIAGLQGQPMPHQLKL